MTAPARTVDAHLAMRIRLEREQRGWSLADLAQRSGVSRAMINKVERGESSPTAALLGRLSGALGLTMSTLLARAEAASGGRLPSARSRTGRRHSASPHTGRPWTCSPRAPRRSSIR